MQIIILQIVNTLLKIALILIGDKYLSKWLAAGQYWYRTIADDKLKAQVERDFKAYSDGWGAITKDRKPFRPDEKDLK